MRDMGYGHCEYLGLLISVFVCCWKCTESESRGCLWWKMLNTKCECFVTAGYCNASNPCASVTRFKCSLEFSSQLNNSSVKFVVLHIHTV